MGREKTGPVSGPTLWESIPWLHVIAAWLFVLMAVASLAMRDRQDVLVVSSSNPLISAVWGLAGLSLLAVLLQAAYLFAARWIRLPAGGAAAQLRWLIYSGARSAGSSCQKWRKALLLVDEDQLTLVILDDILRVREQEVLRRPLRACVLVELFHPESLWGWVTWLATGQGGLRLHLEDGEQIVLRSEGLRRLKEELEKRLPPERVPPPPEATKGEGHLP